MDNQNKETGMDRKRVEAEVVRCRRDKDLRWRGGMTRQKREIEVIRWKKRQGSQGGRISGWSDGEAQIVR